MCLNVVERGFALDLFCFKVEASPSKPPSSWAKPPNSWALPLEASKQLGIALCLVPILHRQCFDSTGLSPAGGSFSALDELDLRARCTRSSTLGTALWALSVPVAPATATLGTALWALSSNDEAVDLSSDVHRGLVSISK